jgi:ribosomal protein S18 acetylase RimI-like enzyme
MHVLDAPIWHSLVGPHAYFALVKGRARRYPAEVSPFAAVEALDDDALGDLAALVPAGEVVAVFAPEKPLAEARWKRLFGLDGLQMVCERPVAPPAREPSPLGPGDVEPMLALAKRTEPGPFESRTIELGRFVGFKDPTGQLIAMGGERMHPAGYTEVSGICTAAEARGRGLAEAIVRAVASGIQARGEIPFLHVRIGSPTEATAVALYERVGFRERRRFALEIVQRRALTSRAAP